jgi:alkylation response protein AidB-like acyl-CoA dehydrogenase
MSRGDLHLRNDAQKKKYLPQILSARIGGARISAGFGSDLASSDQGGAGQRSLRVAATRPGQLARQPTGYSAWWTDQPAKPQAGISFLLIDMKSPGVTVRPIITIDGSHEVNDVFLEDVRVPAENLIGQENKGWTYAKFLLGNERTSMAGIGRSTRYLGRLKHIVRTEVGEDDPTFGSSSGDRARRARCARVGGDGTAHHCADVARHRPGTGRIVVQDQGHRDIPAHH